MARGTAPVPATRVMFNSLKPACTADNKEVLSEGWLNETGALGGQPACVAQLPDGALIVSRDFAGALYRITYDGDGGAMPPN